jgi:glycosyltransferase Alg8
MFRLDRQRWTRQSTSIASAGGREGRVRSLTSSYMHVLALGLLVAGVIFVTGLLSPFPIHAN